MFLSHLPDYQKQFIKFVLIGMLAVLVDLVCYYFFLQFFPEKVLHLFSNEVAAKSCSFVCGSVVTYNLNKFWTWKQKNKSHSRFIKFFLLYIVSLLINVLVNSTALFLLINKPFFQPTPYKYLIAFVLATGVSALFNFIGQKKVIFKIES
jgi:putative flippase GtrA